MKAKLQAELAIRITLASLAQKEMLATATRAGQTKKAEDFTAYVMAYGEAQKHYAVIDFINKLLDDLDSN